MTTRFRDVTFISVLFLSALLLSARLAYLFLSNPERFPIRSVKISASYEHVSQKQIEAILTKHIGSGYFALSIGKLKTDSEHVPWIQNVFVKRTWPDALYITVIEKSPVAIWQGAFLSADGEIFPKDVHEKDTQLPKLTGPIHQQKDVLQIYQKFSKLLAVLDLHIAELKLRENQAWELSLTNGVHLQLGKQDIETRLLRFCRSYPAVFADKKGQLSRVDLRYPRGMAVQWKSEME